MLEVRPPLTTEWLQCLNPCQQITRHDTLLATFHRFNPAANRPLLIRLLGTSQPANVPCHIHAKAKTQILLRMETLEVRLLRHLLTDE